MMHAPDLAAEPHLAPAQKAKQSWLDTLRNWGFENAFDLTEDEVVQRYLALDEATKRQAIEIADRWCSDHTRRLRFDTSKTKFRHHLAAAFDVAVDIEGLDKQLRRAAGNPEARRRRHRDSESGASAPAWARLIERTT